jgi:hypothetical protein
MKGVKILFSDGKNFLKKFWLWFKKRKFWQTIVIVLIVIGLMGLGTAIGVYKARGSSLTFMRMTKRLLENLQNRKGLRSLMKIFRRS